MSVAVLNGNDVAETPVENTGDPYSGSPVADNRACAVSAVSLALKYAELEFLGNIVDCLGCPDAVTSLVQSG
mgnify:FL=1